MIPAHLADELNRLGVVIPKQPQEPTPIIYGWKPTYKGEEPPF